MIHSILHEYGISWAINRGLYSAKLKLLNLLPAAEAIFEKKTVYPKRINFFELDTERLKQFIQNLSQIDKQNLIKSADKACKGRILGFSSIELDYGYPVQWNLNPITGKRWDGTKKWYEIPDFDKEQGDIKAVWEISRFSHFITLSRAYLLTEDEKYYKAFSEQLEDWLKKNPYPYGVNYKCGQECALRMVNALFAYKVFADCGLAAGRDQKNVEKLAAGCYRKIRSNFFYAYRCIKNNHTISELLGMLVGAWCCGDRGRIRAGFEILNQVIDEQFTADGGYVQHSFNYERLALQDIEVALAAEKRLGVALNEKSRKKLLKAVEMMYQCQDDCGDMPNYGSNDGALAFPLTSCGYRDFRPVLNTVHVLLTGERLYEKGSYDEELIWLGKRSLDSLKHRKKERASHAFQEAGLYTIRNGDSWIMTVLNDYHSRPAHMDQLHIDLWIRGINVLCDGGTYSYAEELGRRLVRNENHNTVVYGKKAQMNIRGAFFLYGWTKRERADAALDSFCGTMRSQNAYSHERRIKAGHKGYLILDIVRGKDGEKYEICFHTPCEIQKEGNQVKLLHEGKCMCVMRLQGPFRIFESSRSLYYLKEDKSRCIAVRGVIRNGRGSMRTEIMVKGQ